jgi:hypothetical protein
VKVGKRIRHMGMSLTEDEHEKWHRENHEVTPEQHEVLMKRMGISKEEDEKWHKTHEISTKEACKAERKPVNPFAVGGGFLADCVGQGWLVQEGKGRNAKYYVTNEGKKELRKFDIKP